MVCVNEIWILGATGRTGRAIAARLAGHPTVLVGRDPRKLVELRGETRLATTMTELLELVHRSAPPVLVNTIGPYVDSPILRALPPRTHYVDLANEIDAVRAVLDRHETDRTVVTGAGWGVLGVESVVLKVCEGRPAPVRLRVDALASVANEGGRMGEALAGSIVGGFAAGGARYKGGKLVKAALAGDVEKFALPDGEMVATASLPTGDLEVAHRASGAGDVVSASGLAPTRGLVRAVLPAVSALVKVPVVARFAQHRMAGIEVKAGPAPRLNSWARARAEWSDGTVREAWLKAPEGMAFTAAVAAEVAIRLAGGDCRPGGFTPGALFGASLAESAGGEFLI
jgi:short subunit dehydrogenase-like uncharacterized protein